MESPSDDFVPPPAYSEQEFDIKISLATDLSSQLQAAQSAAPVDGEGWEAYDPSAFSEESNVTLDRDRQSDLNTLPSIQPLRIEKKAQTKTVRPSVDPSAGHFSVPYNGSHSTSGSGSWESASRDAAEYSAKVVAPRGLSYAHSSSPSHFNDQTNSSLHTFSQYPQERIRDKPRPSHVDTHNLQTRSSHHTATQSFDARLLSTYPRSQLPVQPHTPRRALPPQPSHQVLPQDPTTAVYQPPRMSFDPSIAYGKPPGSPYHPPPSPRSPVQYDPHSFYNSVVSAQMAPLRPTQGPLPQYPPYNQKQSQGQTTSPAIRQGYRPDSNYTMPTSRTPMPDINRFSQYPETPSRYV